MREVSIELHSDCFPKVNGRDPVVGVQAWGLPGTGAPPCTGEEPSGRDGGCVQAATTQSLMQWTSCAKPHPALQCLDYLPL